MTTCRHTTEVRTGDQRGRHTTVAAQLLALPGEGWLVDTPGVRAMSLWLSGDGIERAFADVFELMEHCRFRDCKHDQEPGCAVRDAIEEGRLDPDRFASLERLVAEEAALEEEQRSKEKAGDRRRGGRPITTAQESADAESDDDDDRFSRKLDGRSTPLDRRQNASWSGAATWASTTAATGIGP